MAEGGQDQMVDGDPGEHVVEEEVQEAIMSDEKMDPGLTQMEDVSRADQMGGRPWHSIISSKRPYPDEDEMDDELDQHYAQGYRRPVPDGPRKRGRPRKFPPGVPPPDYLARIQAKALDSQMQDIEYEDEHPVHQGARVVAMNSRIMASRPSTIMSSAVPPRLSQQAAIRLQPPVGQASHLAAQRLPALGGGPPKENKPLKVVTLLPNSRRMGAGPPRPVVSAIRTLGQPQVVKNKIPQLPIEKQAEMIISQAVKQGERLVPGQSLGEFNKIIDTLNGQILSLQEDNKKLNNLYTGLIEFKDNRIKQLETQVERLQTEVANAMKNWQAQMLLTAPGEQEEENKDQENIIHMHQISHGGRPRLTQVSATADGQWIITDSQGDPNGDIQEEIIEEEVDEETFLRMQQEMQESGGELIVHHEHHDVESGEVVDRGPEEHHQMA